MGLAQSLAPNAALWKEFNEALRLLFRSQAFPDQFIKQYFEQLQSNINRERRAGAVHRNQPVQNHNRQNIPYGGGNNQFGNFFYFYLTLFFLILRQQLLPVPIELTD